MSESKTNCPHCGREPGGIHMDACRRSSARVRTIAARALARAGGRFRPSPQHELGNRAKRRNLVKIAVLSFLLAFAAPLAHADTLGGARQAYDKAHCAAYESVWPEYTRIVAGVGTYEYGPEATIPPSPPVNPTPEQQAAADAFGNLSLLNARYNPSGSLPAAIGYDQYGAAFAVANDVGPHGSGPFLSDPSPLAYPGLGSNAEQMRAYRVDLLVSALSHRQTLTQAKLDAIRTTLHQTPTCGGAAY